MLGGIGALNKRWVFSSSEIAGENVANGVVALNGTCGEIIAYSKLRGDLVGERGTAEDRPGWYAAGPGVTEGPGGNEREDPELRSPSKC